MDWTDPPTDLSEGDSNFGPHRQSYIDGQIDPATRELLRRDEAVFLRQSLSTPCLNALASAEGSTITDHAGRVMLDFHGNAVHQLGYAHPAVIEAIKRQLDELSFCPRRYTNRPAIELAERLTRLARLAPINGDRPGKVLFTPSGTLAIGTALKLARLATGRYKTISMWGSFHGASMDAISIGGEALFREGLGPLLPGCIHVPPYGDDAIGQRSLEIIESVLEQDREIGAVIAEPMRWTTAVAPPAWYWQELRELCTASGTLLILDEVPSCLGRTGRMFCIEHAGVRPDMLVLGKGLGGGVFPMAAVIADARLDIAPHTALGHYTHEKSPVGAAAALATLDVIEREGLVQRAADAGRLFADRLRALAARHDCVLETRGLGLHHVVELRSRSGGTAELADRVLYHCLERGLSLKVSAGSMITLSPPLNISDADLDRALSMLDQAVAEASQPKAKAAGKRKRQAI